VGVTETAAPLLSKLFPQTAPDADNGAEQERKKREEDEAKENERAWKRMKLGFVTVYTTAWYVFLNPCRESINM